MEAHFANFRISDALMSLYKLFWDIFCDRYLEIVKPEYGKPIDKQSYDKTIALFDKLLRLLHPFMPFITEELWQNITERKDGESICVAAYPKVETTPDQQILSEAEVAFEAITLIRNTRATKEISPNTALELKIKTTEKAIFERFWGYHSKVG